MRGFRFEEKEACNQSLTFLYLEKKFKDNNLVLDNYQELNIILDNKFTNLALLLSDQCPYSIKCTVFNGIDKMQLQVRKEFKESILKQVDDLFEYFDLFNKVKGTIVGLKRIDTYDYPSYSLREGLLNAVIHRSYYFDSSILVNLYDNRFEIISMGGLIDGINIEEIFKGISFSRNPNLANIFYRLGYVESSGTGIGRIMDSYLESGKKPVFEATTNTFVIILPNINYKDEKNLNESLTQEDKIINYLKDNSRIKRSEAEELLNISKSRTSEVLNKLTEKELVEKRGSGRSTFYVLK